MKPIRLNKNVPNLKSFNDITVIVILYNSEKVVKNCLENLLGPFSMNEDLQELLPSFALLRRAVVAVVAACLPVATHQLEVASGSLGR